ncbi:cache domain-containing protein, partial [Campylobacter sp. B0100352/1]|nr:cache domain-containing protein [Campylobacter sp. B0100352/1]
MFKSLNIGTKLILCAAISIIIGLAIMIFFISLQVSSNMEKQAEEAITIASKRYINYMQSALNEPIVLSNTTDMAIQDIIKDDGQVNTNIVQNLIKNTLDGSIHTTYAFLYLKDPSILVGGDKDKFLNKDGTLSMIFYDSTLGSAGGIKITPYENLYQSALVLQKLEKNADFNNPHVEFGKPMKLNYGHGEFLGINFAVPLFNKSGKYIGSLGFSLEFSEMSKTLLDPKLNFHEGDQRILFSDDARFIIHENPKALLEKISDYNHSPSVKPIVEAIKGHKDLLMNDFLTSTGFLSYASVVSFSTLNDSSHWSILVTTPRSSVLAPVYKLQFSIIIIAIIFLVIVLGVIYICVRKIISSKISMTLHYLQNFFRFLNHETKDVQTIEIHSNDELGQMGKII